VDELVNKKQKFQKITKIDKDSILYIILENVYGKLYFYLVKNQTSTNLLNILINIEVGDFYTKRNLKCNLLDDYKRITDFYKYFSSVNGCIVKTYKRLNNLLIEYNDTRKFKPIIGLQIKSKIKEENALYEAYFAIKKEVKYNLTHKNYYQTMISLDKFNDILNDFLNKVFIEKDSFFKRQKRLKLLFSIKHLFNEVTDFGRLVTKL
jgi:glycyl-tRNA synthetase beta subunit